MGKPILFYRLQHPTTVGEEGEQRARSGRRAGRGTRARNFGQEADLRQSGQAKFPQKQKHCGRRGAQSPQRALHARPTPRCRAPSSPCHHRSLGRVAVAETAFATRNHSRATLLSAPCPECRWGARGGALRGSFRRDLGTREGRRRGRGGVTRVGPTAPADPSGSPGSAPRSHGPQPDGSQACQSRPAFLRPPCPITAALSIRAPSRQSQSAQSRPGPSAWSHSPVRLRRRSRHRRFGCRRSCVPAAAASAGAVGAGKGGRELPVQVLVGIRFWSRETGRRRGAGGRGPCNGGAQASVRRRSWSDGSCGCAIGGAAPWERRELRMRDLRSGAAPGRDPSGC
ncbi:uncharacterized protein [Agelaius tricolor]|uniref:uncharacterized protein isoform X2 n=1 Tax=Agelaius tricolor TaxID=9191 RepID=UPI0039F221B6